MAKKNLLADAASGGTGKHRDEARRNSRFTRPIALGAMALGALSVVPVFAVTPAANASCAAFGGFKLGTGTVGGFTTGSDCKAEGAGSFAIAFGEAAQAFANGISNKAISIGNGAVVNANDTNETKYTKNTGIAIGNNSKVNSHEASGLESLAIGNNSKILSDGGFNQQSFALGEGAAVQNGISTNSKAVAIGKNASVGIFGSNESTAIAVGEDAYARSILGQGPDNPDQKANNTSIAFGKGALAQAGAGVNNTAVAVGDGSHSDAAFGNGNRSFAFGRGSTAIAGIEVPIDPNGIDALVTAGNKGKYSNNRSTAIGDNTRAIASKVRSGIATAIGNKSKATVNNDGGNATAVGGQDKTD